MDLLSLYARICHWTAVVVQCGGLSELLIISAKAKVFSKPCVLCRHPVGLKSRFRYYLTLPNNSLYVSTEGLNVKNSFHSA